MIINDSRTHAFLGRCAPAQAPLDRPEYLLPVPYQGKRVQLAVETFRRHMTDEGWQIQLGLEAAGWQMWGPKLPNHARNVPDILVQVQPVSVVVQDKGEWDPAQGSCFDKNIGFYGVGTLRNRSNIFRAAIFRDAHRSWQYQRAFHEEISAHAWIVLYHPEIICRLAPWVRKTDIVRTYQSVDPVAVPPYSDARPCEAVVSGAVDGGTVYPFRHAVFTSQICDRLAHPGYGANGTCTPTYLQTLSKYKVSICTTSIFGYALRKIIESVACGCVVITDLPAGDSLPEIDDCLVRVAPNIPMPQLRQLIKQHCGQYDAERQSHYAAIAREYYDWRRLGLQLGRDLEWLRYGRELERLVKVEPSPEIQWREDFGLLLNKRGLLGQAVEVGTDRGDFAKAFLDGWKGECLWCVDPWDNTAPGWTGLKPDGTPDASGDGRPWLESDRGRDRSIAEAKLQAAHPGRFKLLVTTSRRAIPQLPQIVAGYDDGNHFREYVAEDIALLWERLVPGGILAGHDWTGPWQNQVRPAVLAHAAEHGLTVYTMAGDRISGTASWYMEKPQ